MNKNLTQFLYFIISIFSSCLIIIKTGLYASILTIESYSIINKFFLIALTFLQYGGLGLQYSLQKYLPQFFVKKENDKFFDLIILTISLYIIVAIAAGFIFLFYFWYANDYLIFVLVPLYMFSQLLFFVVLTQQRSKLSFFTYSVTNFSKSLITLISIFLIAKFSRNTSWFIAIEIIINCLFSNSVFKMYFKWLARCSNHLSYLKINLKRYSVGGFKLLINNGVIFALMSLDKWLALIILSSTSYGLYSFALLVLTASETVQQVLNISLYSYFGKLFADGRSQIAFKIAQYTFAIIVILGAVVYAPLLNIFKWGITHYFPKYDAVNDILYLIMLSGIIRCANFFSSYCIMADMEIKLSKSLFIFIVFFSLILSIFAINNVLDLNKIAIIPVLTSSYLIFISFIYAFKHYNEEKKELKFIESV